MQPDIKYTVYHTRRKGLLLKIKNDGSLALYCPKGYPKKKALDFIIANSEKAAALANERKRNALITVFGSNENAATLLYLGKRYPVLSGENARLKFDGTAFYAPEDIGTDALLAAYREFLRAEAKRLLPPLTASLAKAHGLTYKRVFIKSSSSRFGSFSSNGNISYSLSLMAFDESFIRFTVLHELAHSVHFNHGKEFHLLLETICPDCKAIEKRYKKEYSEISRSICR